MKNDNLPPVPAPFTLATPRVSDEDATKLRALVRSRQTNFDRATVEEIATRAYRIGSESCHRAMAALPLTTEELTPLADLERRAMERAYLLMKGNVQNAAKLLGIGKTTLYRKLKSFGLLKKPERCPNCGADLLMPFLPKTQ